MDITAPSSIKPMPQLTPVEAKQVYAASTTPTTTSSLAKLPLYASPVYRFDSVANIPITLIRDPMTGAVTNQIPPEAVVEKYRLGQLRSSNLGDTATDSSSRQTAALAAAATAQKTTGLDAVTASAKGTASASTASSVSIRV